MTAAQRDVMVAGPAGLILAGLVPARMTIPLPMPHRPAPAGPRPEARGD